MRTLSASSLVALLLGAIALPASAQVLTFAPELSGDLPEADSDALREALEEGLAADGRVDVIGIEDTADLLGDGAVCADAECAIAAGVASQAALGAAAEIYGEAEIYDYTIRIFRLSDGEVVGEAVGDCTFCPVAEAVESLRFTAEAALGDVAEIPAAVTPVVVEVAPPPAEEPEPTPEPEPPAEVAFVEGDIQVNISAEPDDAEIRVNGQLVGNGRVSLNLGPQRVEVVAIADGHSDAVESMQLTEAMRGPIFLRLGLAPEPQVVAEAPRNNPAPRNTPAPVDEATFNRMAVGGISAGVGALLLGGGIAALAFDGKTNCTSGAVSACPELYETTGLGIALTAIGGIGIGVGTGFMIRGARDNAAEAALNVVPARGGAMVRLGARF